MIVGMHVVSGWTASQKGLMTAASEQRDRRHPDWNLIDLWIVSRL